MTIDEKLAHVEAALTKMREFSAERKDNDIFLNAEECSVMIAALEVCAGVLQLLSNRAP